MEQMITKIVDHGGKCLPYEACGFVIEKDGNLIVLECKNKAEDTYGENYFVMDSEALAWAKSQGEVKYIYHTHPHGSHMPSIADYKGCNQSEIPWLIVDPHNGKYSEINPGDGPGFVLPLLNRPFAWGIFDCYSLVTDYYKQEFNIELPQYDRGLLFAWVKNPDWDKFNDLFQEAGFLDITLSDSPILKGDVMLMSIGSAPNVANHCGVITDPNTNSFLHHLLDRKSEVVVYGGWYERTTIKRLRHKLLLP